MLKLNVVACGNGYQADGFGNRCLSPSQFDLDVVFHTSNGASFVGVGCYGNGWAVSNHVLWRPLGLVVGYNPEAPISNAPYDFWIKMSWYPGEWMVTATSRYPWTSDGSGPYSSPQASYRIPLQISTAMHSMVAGSAYGTLTQTT